MNSCAVWSSKSNRRGLKYRSNSAVRGCTVWLMFTYTSVCLSLPTCHQQTLDQRQIHVSRHWSGSPSYNWPKGKCWVVRSESYMNKKSMSMYQGFKEWFIFFNLPQVWQVAKPYIEKYETEYIPESRPVSPTAFSLEPPASPRKRVRLEWSLTLKTVWIMLIKMFICFFRWTVL